jgi:hypothetical protein
MVTLLAGVFVWLNVREYGYVRFRTGGGEEPKLAVFLYRGWPCDFVMRRGGTLSSPSNGGDSREADWDWPVFMLDVALCLTLLAVAAIAIEWLMRRMRRSGP